MSNRIKEGNRVNFKWDQTTRLTDGTRKVVTDADKARPMPKLANPGNIIDCGVAGGGNIGSKLAHENEAPFPEALAEFFIKSFCPPKGRVLDCVAGSGTTCAVAEKNGRRWTAIDIRESQRNLINKRMREEVRI